MPDEPTSPSHATRVAPRGCGRRTVSRLCAVAWLLWPVLAAGAEATRESVRQHAREIVAGSRYQTSLDVRSGRADGPVESAQDPGRTAREPPPAALTAAGGLAAWILWMLGGVAAVIILLWIVALVRERGAHDEGPAPGARTDRRARRRSAVVPTDAARRADDPTLGEADRLAAAGRYEEAIHALLLGALGHLAGARAEETWGDAHTSREILGLIPPDDRHQPDLRGLVVAVELSLFGGRPATAALFDACRAHFTTLREEAAP